MNGTNAVLQQIDREERAEPAYGEGRFDDGIPERRIDPEADRAAQLARLTGEPASTMTPEVAAMPVQPPGSLAAAAKVTIAAENRRRARPIRRDKDGRIFPGGAIEAAEALGVRKTGIYTAASMGTSYKGSRWSYPTSEEPVVQSETATQAPPQPAIEPPKATRRLSASADTGPATPNVIEQTTSEPQSFIAVPAPADLQFVARAMMSLGRGGQQLDPEQLGGALHTLSAVADARRTLDLLASGVPIRFVEGRFVPAEVPASAPLTFPRDARAAATGPAS